MVEVYVFRHFKRIEYELGTIWSLLGSDFGFQVLKGAVGKMERGF